MKKIDKLVLQSFFGPLILTFLVVVFILLSKQMLYYFDDIIGKGLGLGVVLQFLFYFAVVMLPAAMPLAILLASLIAFGNLAENFELTALKAGGISPLRVIQPVGILAILLTGIAFMVNNKLVPYAALEAYTLLYDIRQKKPTLDIREGIFYNGIPGVSIKVNKKFAHDDAALKEIILYDHSDNEGNSEVLVADSGRMATVFNERYLHLQFYNGYQYTEQKNDNTQISSRSNNGEVLTRRSFAKSEMMLDLSSFDLSRTDKNLFEGNRMMHDISELQSDIDTVNRKIARALTSCKGLSLFTFYNQEKQSPTPTAGGDAVDSLYIVGSSSAIVQNATNVVRQARVKLQDANALVENLEQERILYELQWHKILATAFACFTMFLIGAPLGVIIKKGGLGVPFLVSVFLFIVFTLLSMNGEKLAKQSYIHVMTGSWIANVLLSVTGCFLFHAARNDARLFESDFYKAARLRLYRTFARRK